MFAANAQRQISTSTTTNTQLACETEMGEPLATYAELFSFAA